MAINESSTKCCTKCGIYKPLTEFHKRKASRKDGLCPLCKPCAIKKAQAHYAANTTKKSKYDAEYREKNKDRLALIRQEYLRTHGQENRDRAKTWAANNPDKVRVQKQRVWAKHGQELLLKLKEWKKNNKHKSVANVAKRRAKKRFATPAWANVSAINDIYRYARENGLHVDHIVPIRSKIVCGLHVEHNLQPLPPHDNHVKSNRHWPDMP